MKQYDLVVIGGGLAGTAVPIAKKDCVQLTAVNTDKLRKTLKQNGAFCG